MADSEARVDRFQVVLLVCITAIAALGVGGVILSPAQSIVSVGFCGTIIAQLGVMFVQRMTAQATAAKVETVAATLRDDTAAVAETLRRETSAADVKLTKIHAAVNGNLGVQLRLTALALRRVAELEENATNEEAARLAELAYAEHVAQQPPVA